MSFKVHALSATVVGFSLALVAHGQVLVTGAGSAAASDVRKTFEPGGQLLSSFLAYSAAFTGGVRVAVGDVNGDGVPDILTAPGAGGGPEVKAFDGVTGAQIRDFFAFSPSFTGGVYIASGRISSMAHADIVVAGGAGGGPQVIIYDGQSGAIVRSFFAFAGGFTGGIRVAVGDVNGDGVGDVVVGAGPGAPPEVKVFDGATGGVIRDFFAYATTYTGGVFVAAGDIDGNGTVEIITGTDEAVGSTPLVKVFNGQTSALVTSFLSFAPTFAGGVRVAAGDVNGDGITDIVTAAGPGGAPTVAAFSGSGVLLRTFNAYAPTFTGGVFVAAGACTPIACPPPNDGCAGAAVLSLGTAQIGTNTGSTPSVTLANNPSNPFCTQATWAAGPQKDVYFQFTAPTTGLYTIDTCGSSFDTILGVHSGCPATGANMIACNDDSTSGAGNSACPGSNVASRIPTVTLLAGQTYFIRVFGYSGATGTVVVTVGNALGACCTGTHCAMTASFACPGTFQGVGVLCGPVGNPTTCCPANFNAANGLTVQDIFDFLGAWFAGDPRANFNGVNGVSVQDIFDFLNAWFAGC